MYLIRILLGWEIISSNRKGWNLKPEQVWSCLVDKSAGERLTEMCRASFATLTESELLTFFEPSTVIRITNYCPKIWGLRFILNDWNRIQYANEGHFLVGINKHLCLQESCFILESDSCSFLKGEIPNSFSANFGCFGHSATSTTVFLPIV